MSAKMDQKQSHLTQIIKNMESVLVAFSGGVDSTLLLKVAVIALGKDNVWAVTARSSTYPVEEQEASRQIADSIGARQLFVDSEELDIDGFSSNPVNRCYYCKKELFTKLITVAHKHGMQHVLDGANFDDLGDHRPGMLAAEELGVRSPLKEAELTKMEIRELSQRLELPTWNKPAFACLSSRFPYGTEITKEKLQQVGQAESYLRKLNLGQFRVRHHGETARIEIDKSAFSTVMARTGEIVDKLKQCGFTYVTLDLEGYRTGSMNETIK
ncbi:ATP-dependent sacrificial sulfur transferase LarE [Metallumcola ferriviriculae]|uniref:ATP-dependent sacrificial sulfur transferase LarE n=1 Tax=Metallumcola ferriviriculae TaxID=3039180 RepID=A0AAU0UMJ2_9FIRM|nr:ATP-dependent sacrificial sulfur transferase LarE [Desulfitibacteraceae bacterium MK1]